MKYDRNQIARALCENGADPCVLNSSNGTSIGSAAARGNLALVEYLIAKVRKPTDISARIDEVVRSAAEANQKTILREYIDHCSVQAKSDSLVIAAESGAVQAVQILITKAIPLSYQRNSDSCPPLIAASRGGHADVIEVLLKAGARPEQSDSEGHLALPMAVSYQNLHPKTALRCVQLLISHGADPNVPEKTGGAVMEAASSEGSADVLQYLLQHGGNSNSTDSSGRTALMQASENGAVEMVKLLIEAGADVNREGPQHEIAWSLARDRSKKQIHALLIKGGFRKRSSE